MPLPAAVFECLLNSELLDFSDLLTLCCTSKALHARLAGGLPHYLEYDLSRMSKWLLLHKVGQLC